MGSIKKIFFILSIMLLGTKLSAQITAIPDARFERALIDLGIDSDHTINGHILTADALSITELILNPSSIPNYPYSAVDFNEGLIHDVTGIEAFVNLNHLVINVTMINQLNLQTLTQLQYLDCVDNMLVSLDLSNNTLLEYLNITSVGDVFPMNDFSAIDLSHNPLINTLIAPGVDAINLNNNNNNPNMTINVSCNYCWNDPPDYMIGSICIKVDNAALAQNNQFPYSAWTVQHSNITLHYTNNLEQCALGVANFKTESIKIYPNPIVSGVLYIITTQNITINKAIITDVLGRKIFEQNIVNSFIDVSDLKKGNYLLTMTSNVGSQREKIIVK